MLRAPESVQTVWDRVRASAIDLDEARVVMPMRQLAAVWPSLFAAEQRRLAQLLIERVLIGDDGLEILWRDAGWVELIDELRESYTIVIVTHSMQQAARVSQRTAYFHLGDLIEVGTTDDVFTRPSHRLTEDYITGRFG